MVRTTSKILLLVALIALALVLAGTYVAPARAANAPGALSCSTLSIYNPTHYALADGATVTCQIVNATDVAGMTTVPVYIKSSALGNTQVDGTVSGTTITFTYTAPFYGCLTTNVAYLAVGNTATNDIIDDGILNGSGSSAAGFGFVDSNGNHIDACAKDLTVSKTAVPSYTRTYKWDIDKSVDQPQINIAEGGSATFNYTVDVTHDTGTDSDWAVSGVITVHNPNWFDLPGVNVTDDLPGGTCVVDSGTNVTVPAGGDANVAYKCNFTSNPGSGTNTATATWQYIGSPNTSAQGSAGFTFGDPTTIVHGSVTVSDPNAPNPPLPATVSYTDPSPTTFKYAITFKGDPAGTCTNHENTASLTYDDKTAGPSDNVTVKVCVGADPKVSKTAVPSFTRQYNWEIAKSADQSSLTLQVNQTFAVNYTVTVKATGFTDSGWQVAGKITVQNLNDWEAITLNDVTDAVDNGGTCKVTPPTNVTIAASSSADLDYTCVYASKPTAVSGTNTATATWDAAAYFTPDSSAQGTATFDFKTPTTFKDTCVDVSDSLQGPLGKFCVDTSKALPQSFDFPYQRNVGPYSVCGPYQVINTATFTTNDTGTTGSASWTVNVTVPCNGCTLTIGYWKTHAGFGPQPDAVTPLLPQYLGTSGGTKTITVTTAALAVQFLSFDGSNNVFDASNGINKLYAQLLAAKLNIANGADGSAVATAITAADAFLATHDSTSWSSLTKTEKNQVLSWASKFDNFNNGLIGPGHCSETGVTSKLLQVSGGVYASGSNTPQAGVNVQIYNTAGTLLATVVTNKYGQFIWKYSGNLGRLVIRAPGYGKAQKLTVGAARQVVANWIQ